MADVTVSTRCTSFEPDGQICRLTGAACPMAGARSFRECDDSTYLAHVSMPPDEFQVLLSAAGRPAVGSLMVRRCRRPELHQGAVGVHVNAVLESAGDEAMLRAEWKMDGSVEYTCPATGVRMEWREGKFIPL
ncbi:MAG TPA: hypothetical protein VEA69_08335 [Tepidisphaeraceae bacterium]|nr:hypothetical protein [Tepidisphaeraceae bacterium]